MDSNIRSLIWEVTWEASGVKRHRMFLVIHWVFRKLLSHHSKLTHQKLLAIVVHQSILPWAQRHPVTLPRHHQQYLQLKRQSHHPPLNHMRVEIMEILSQLEVEINVSNSSNNNSKWPNNNNHHLIDHQVEVYYLIKAVSIIPVIHPTIVITIWTIHHV